MGRMSHSARMTDLIFWADESEMRIGYMTHRQPRLSPLGSRYLEALKRNLEPVLTELTPIKNAKF